MRTTTVLAMSVAMGLSTLASGQTATTRPPNAAAVGRYTAIGCVSRQGTAAAPRYTVTDRRGDSPTVYRLEGDAALLTRHVGHTVEVAGPLGSAQAGTAQRVLKVHTLVWLASSCRSATK